MPNALATTTQAKPKQHRVNGKIAAAIEVMIYEGKPYDVAARNVNVTVRAMRKALEKPHVLAYLREQRQVFRASLSAETLQHAAKIMRRGRNEMAKLKAMSFIEGSDDDRGNSHGASRASAGLTIQIIGGGEVRAGPLQAVDIVESDNPLQMVSESEE